MLFRPRREDYKHSIAAATEIKSFEELATLVNKEVGKNGLIVSINDVGHGHDISTRYIVCIQYSEGDTPSAIGYLLDSPKNLLNFIYKTKNNSDRSISYYQDK